MGLDAALAWETCTFGMTKKLPCLDSLFTKITVMLLLTEWEVSTGIYCPQPFPY